MNKPMRTPQERLKEVRILAGYASPTEAARAMGAKTPTYLGHENPNSGRPLTRAAQRYVEFFGTKVANLTLDWLLREKGPAPKRLGSHARGGTLVTSSLIDDKSQVGTLRELVDIPIAGLAEAGAFRPMLDLDQEFETSLATISAEKSKIYPNAKHFALEVRGNSMNASRPPIVNGMIVYCVDMHSAEIDIESGKIYAVRRTMDGGSTWECTIKRAMVYKDRFELVPESTNPAHEKLLIPRGAGHDDLVKSIEAFGLVYALHLSLEGQP